MTPELYKKIKAVRDRDARDKGLSYSQWFKAEDWEFLSRAGYIERGPDGMSVITFLGRVALAAHEAALEGV